MRLQRLAPLVEKTGGPAERRAFALLSAIRERESNRSRAVRRRGFHFGLFSFGNPGRQFGGVGVMVAAPGLRLALDRADQFAASGPVADEICVCAEQCRAAWQFDALPPCHIQLESAPRRHVGIG